MALHMTKIAFGAKSVDDLRGWLERLPDAFATTRYLPKRHEEMLGGSLYWIFDHTLVGRSPIRGFTQRDDGRWNIMLEPRLIPVEPRAKRAHQGWRYLKPEDAPPDLGSGEIQGDVLPSHLVKELAKLGLV
ncbi:hypothetical protein MB02_15125 [Croceicoccus estronivorus]|uniref:DUF1489 family protein n=1 Tax=Croceicoccus estronivorus TaxID=1172626 RepID=UPI000836D365|nr:DUF1489 domain-containing protein [Croceicoccus estronivorus]OCC22744.1 hypothetical protein MB02_15125 [Croceicoccus estronivorus]